MIKQITSIDGELAIKIKPEDNLKYGDIIILEKVESKKLRKKEVQNGKQSKRSI